jgi:hypothetical protein
MDISLQIKSLLSEAELYRSQGLFTEAKDKYLSATAMIHKIGKLKNKDKSPEGHLAQNSIPREKNGESGDGASLS